MAEKPHLLIVEGKDELHVVSRISESYDILENFKIEVSGSNDQAIDKFISSIFASDFNKVGVLLDFEPNQNVWGKLYNGLQSYKPYYKTIPHDPLEGGVIVEANGTNKLFDNFGIWLMPNNKDKGTLENFLLSVVNSGNVQIAFAEETLKELEKRGLDDYKPVHRNKALIHTYLAWQENPGAPYGTALKQKAFDIEHPDVQALANWLRQLFA